MELLKPLTHRRYITCYCVADLEVGTSPIKDQFGNVIASLTDKSKRKLEIEGVGRLPSGDMVNVGTVVDGEKRFVLIPPNIKFGYGIRSKPLEPWVSVAVNLSDIKSYDLFKRTIILKQLYNYTTPDNITLSGELIIHDTGSALRACPYSGGLFRSGSKDAEHGQVDVFVGDEWVYKKLFGSWKMYQDCIIMPRDTYSEKGIQETLNVLMDAGLVVDGRVGVKTKRAINNFKHYYSMDEDGIWDEKTKELAKLSLNNWR
jgi:hypothetical protein